METSDNYLEVNKNAWNQKTEIHIGSDFYDMPSFISGKNVLPDLDIEMLGNINGKDILHLQCHFGQDTISMSRMGANVTGVDLSDKAIETARKLATQCYTNTKFVCCDVYSAPQNISQQFDVVYTSYGTIGWLPDIQAWAKVVAHFLKPGAEFIFADFHPVIWMFDNDLKEVTYSYFNKETIVEEIQGTYADKNADITTKTISWNHGLSEVMQALINEGLEIVHFKEFDYSPYNCFSDMEEFEPGKFRFAKYSNKLPVMYALKAIKK